MFQRTEMSMNGNSGIGPSVHITISTELLLLFFFKLYVLPVTSCSAA